MGNLQQGGGVTVALPAMGQFTRLGLIAAIVTVAADQASKLWLLFVFDLPSRGTVNLLPFLDFVMVWNTGISYGLFPQNGEIGQWVLFAIKIAAVVLLLGWLFRAGSKLTALGLGLIVGGALGNAIDRVAHGAVADFVLFYVATATYRFNWYVFNLADVAIVAGVAGVLYDSVMNGDAQKAP
jgi:signal peptidase II